MSDQNVDSKIDVVLNNGTCVTESLASGGMGVVYIGVDALERRVVVKFLKYDGGRGTSTFAEFKRKFVEEAEIMVNLEDCPAFAKVYHIDKKEEAITMEFIRGTPLNEVLDPRRGEISSRDLRKYLLAFYVIAESLSKAHSAQIVHRDIKPENMIEQPERRGVKVIRLIDVGISKKFRPDSEDIMISGTPDYMPPEQFTEPMTNRQADQYAMGCVLYELFTGERFILTESENPLDVLHQHTDDEYRQQRFSVIDNYRKRALIELMMVKDPRERLGGMLEVMGALKLLERQLQIEEEQQFIMRDSLTELAALIKLGAEGAFGGQWEMQGAQKLLHRQIEARKGKPQTVTAPVPQAMLELVKADPEESVPTEQAVSGSVHCVNSGQLVSEAPAVPTVMPVARTLTPLPSAVPSGHPVLEARRRESSSDELAATHPMESPKRKGGIYLLFIAVLLSAGLGFGLWYIQKKDDVSKPSKSAQLANKPAMRPIVKARRVLPMPMQPRVMRPSPVVSRLGPRTLPKHPYDVLLKKCPLQACKHTTGEEAWIRKQTMELKDPCVALKVFLKMKGIYTVKFVKDKNGKQAWNIKYVGNKQKWGIKWAIKGRSWAPGRLAYKGYAQRCKEYKAAQKAKP